MIITKPELCTGCTVCEKSCPKGAIQMKPNNEGFLYPEISEELCVECGICAKKCPSNNLPEQERLEEPQIFAAKLKDDDALLKSASGGMFTALSDYVLDMGGTVYGAVFDKDFNVHHIKAETKEDRDRMRGSKYTQSSLLDTLTSIKSDLENGRKVLFTGTGCQCAGVRRFLEGTDCTNLFVADLICEGTPSPRVFKDYLKYIAKKHKDKVLDVKFRDKVNGWTGQTMSVKMENSTYYKSSKHDAFYELFFRNVILRPSCHNCPYATMDRQGDVTIGDFWGIDKINPDFMDDKGVSLLIVNTEKGKALLGDIKDMLHLSAQTLEDAKKRQKNLYRPSPKSARREEFWQNYEKKGIKFVLKKYTEEGFLVRVKRGVKKLIRK